MQKLDRKLTLYGLTMVAIGACIGSGIFASPGHIVELVNHQALVLVVWCVGGLIALTGALTFSELGSMFPKAGGVYVFLREAYGDMMGFLYGWVILLVINTGALAALSITFADYMTFFIPLSQSGKVILAICTIISLTIINMTGVNTSQWMANIFTGGKLLALAGLIILGFIFYDPANVELSLNFTDLPNDAFSVCLLALIGVLWAFGGWHHASYLASETIRAERNVPRAMIYGVFIVMVVYVLANLSYMMLLPLDAIAASDKVAGDAMLAIVPWGGKVMALVIAISVFGTIAIYTMSAPRIYFAMAEDGIFFQKLKYIHPKYKTPVYAMGIQAVWAIVLLLFWGTFKELITYVTIMDILFMTLAGVSLFIFRKNRPDQERPVKVIGYPIIPAFFVIISALFVANAFIGKPLESSAGLLILALGVPVYYLFKRKKD